jgi:hypothetical protein
MERALTWYIKYKATVPVGQTRYLTKIKRDLLKEFQKPKFEYQCITEIKEIKKQQGETMWDYDQWFNLFLDRLMFHIQDVQHREWFIVGLLPHIQVPLTQKKVTTQVEVVEIVMCLEATPRGIKIL